MGYLCFILHCLTLHIVIHILPHKINENRIYIQPQNWRLKVWKVPVKQHWQVGPGYKKRQSWDLNNAKKRIKESCGLSNWQFFFCLLLLYSYWSMLYSHWPMRVEQKKEKDVYSYSGEGIYYFKRDKKKNSHRRASFKGI